MSADDFQKMYASVMEGMLKSAVAETRKLFETMVDDLKSEISKIKKENEELKTKCNQFENATTDAKERRRDSAVQCVAEQSGSSQTQGQQSKREELQDVLQKAQHSEAHGQGNSEMTFVIINENVAEVPAVVGMEAFSGLEVAAPVTGLEVKGTVVSQICSNETQTSSQKYEGTSVAQGISSLPNDGKLSCLNEAERPASEPEHRMVLSFVTINSGVAEEPKDCPKGMDIWIDKDLVMFEDPSLLIAQQQPVLEPTENQKSAVASLQHQGDGEMALNKQLKVPLQQPAGVTSTDEQLPMALLSNGAEPDHPVLISLATGNDIEQSIYTPNTFVLLAQGDGQLVAFEEQPMLIALQQSVVEPPEKTPSQSVPQQSPKECDISINDQLGNAVERSSGVPTADKPSPEAEQLENETCAGLTNKAQEVLVVPTPDLTSRRKRGRPPKKRRPFKDQQTPEKSIIESRVDDVPTNQEVVKEVEASSAADNVNALSKESPKPPLDQVPEALSSNMSSVQQAASAHLGEVKNISVSSLPISETSLIVEQPLEMGNKSDSQQPVMGMEVDIQVPTTNVSSDVETTSMPPESHSKPLQPRSRLTSVTLQDAMLLVEAMNTHSLVPQPIVENIVPFTETLTTPQSQSSQPVSESPAQLNVPVAPQASDSKMLPQPPAGTYEALSSLPKTAPPTEDYPVKSIMGPRKSSVIPLTHKNPPRIKVITAGRMVSPSSKTGVSQIPPPTKQTQLKSHPQRIIHPPTSMGPGPDKRKIGTVPQKIIVVPKMSSSLSSHTFGTPPPTQVSPHLKVVNAHKPNLLPAPIVANMPLKSGLCPSVVQKTSVKSQKSLSVVTSQMTSTSTNQQLETSQPQKLTVIIPRRQLPRLPMPVVSKKQEVAVVALPPAHSGTPSQLKTAAEAQVSSDEAVTSSQTRTSTSDICEPAMQSNSVSAKTNTPPKTVSKVAVSPRLMPASVCPPVTPAVQMKSTAVVRLCRLPPTVPPEGVVVSNASTKNKSVLNDSTQTTQEKPSSVVKSMQTSQHAKEIVLLPEIPTSSTDGLPDLRRSEDMSVRDSQITTEPNPVQENPTPTVMVTNATVAVPAEVIPRGETITLSSEKCTLEKAESVDGSTEPFPPSAPPVPAVVNLTEPLAAATENIKPASNLQKDVTNHEVQESVLPKCPCPQEERSATILQLTAVSPRDTSDPHLKMTKTQFLAQLSVSPVVRAPKKVHSKGSSDPSTAAKLQKASIMARLRSRVRKLGKRTEANQKSQPTIPETTPKSQEIPRLECLSDVETFDEDSILADNEKPRVAEDVELLKSASNDSSMSLSSDSIVLNLSADEEDDVDGDVIHEKAGAVLLSTSGTSAIIDNECAKNPDGFNPEATESVSVSPAADSDIDNAGAENPQSTVQSCEKSHSVRSDTNLENVELITISPGTSSSASDSTNPEQREFVSVSPTTDTDTDDVVGENLQSTAESCTESHSMRDDVELQDVGTVTISPGTSSSASDSTNPEQRECVSVSPTDTDDVVDDVELQDVGTITISPGTSSSASDSTNPEQRECVSVSPTIDTDDVVIENPESTAESCTESHSMTDHVELQDVGTVTISPGTSSSVSDSNIPEQRECVSVSPTTDTDISVGAENPESTAESCTTSHSMRDGVGLHDVGSIPISPGGSRPDSADNNPENRECISISPMPDSVDSENPDSTVENCTKSHSVRDDTGPQNVESVTISSGISSSASDDGNPEKGECVSISPMTDSADSENPESTVESWTKSHSMTDDVGLITISARGSSSVRVDDNPKKKERISISPMTDSFDSEKPESAAKSWTTSHSMTDDVNPPNVGLITVNSGSSSSAGDGAEERECASGRPTLYTAIDNVGAKNSKSTENCRKSSSTKHGTNPQNVGSVTVSCGRSSSANDNGNPRKRGHASASPMKSSSSRDQNTNKKTKSTVVTPQRTTTTNGTKPKKTKSIPVTPMKSRTNRDINSKRVGSPTLSSRKSSSAQDGTRPQTAVSASVGCQGSDFNRDVTTPKKTASTSANPRRSIVNKDESVIKQTKSGLSSVKRRRSSRATESSSAKKPRSESSPYKSLPKLAKNGITSKNTGQPPAENPSLIHNGAGPKKSPRVVNAKKLTEAAKAKTPAKTKKSNWAKLQSDSEESETEDFVNSGTEKNSKSKAERATPTTPTIRTPLERDGASQSAKNKESSTGQAEVQVTRKRRVLTSSRLLMKSDLFVSTTENASKKGKAKPRFPVIFPPIGCPLPMPAITPKPYPEIGRVLLKNQCGECGRVLSSQSSLENHVRVHSGSRPFICKLCGKSFPNLKGLKRHIGVHRNGKIHICPHCGKGFVYRFGLTKHILMVHSRIKPFVCQICSRGFFSRRDVEAHIRIHTGEKPFQCNLCQKKFTRKVELNMHLMWHNGEKRHWCAFCGKAFLDYNNMKRHQYIHTGEKPYACTHCPKRFKQSSHLKKHMSSIHKTN
ncbi:mucin-2 isoform X2 [Thalassophryne amazonica]|uniref:mucin-2 isoform X2 n=1 Tax=Thalassophryne amazonica TaxID=390379 RepID=UPI001470EF41|nr:mucin-2 isoform X2 [Thalassophryne amazonica]